MHLNNVFCLYVIVFVLIFLAFFSLESSLLGSLHVFVVYMDIL